MTTDSKTIKMNVFTDPISSSSWVMEPVIRKVYAEYGHLLDINVRVLPILIEGKQCIVPSLIAKHWEQVGIDNGVPITGSVWEKDPPKDSTFGCMAYKVAEFLDPAKACALLQKFKVAIFIKGINIQKKEVLFNLAEEVGYNRETFETEFLKEGKEYLQLDRELANALDITRVPTVVFEKPGSTKQIIQGITTFEILEKALQELSPESTRANRQLDVNSLIKSFGSLTVKELSTLNEISEEESLSLLQSAEYSEKVSCEKGSIWIA